MASVTELSDDERRLAELGYKQELDRSWSGFSNFAISFSIISILAGCFTTFGVGWNNGGPAAIAWGWPIISLFILAIGLCMSELVSAYPTSGGIYWWASKLGGVKAGYYTGWLNLIGLLAIDASVAYGCATFLDLTLGSFDSGYTPGDLNRVFLYFVVVLILVSLINIFSAHLLAVLNNISVWWHVFGALAVVLILWFIPNHHASVSSVFTHTVNNTGFIGGSTHGLGFLLYVLPISAILTQYTITGYDASAHLSEETHGAADTAAKGIWQSIAYSAIGGWVLLLTFLFAVQDEAGVTKGGGAVATIFSQALSSKWAGVILLISTAGQFFCTTACMTSTTRMLFAFSRDGAVPGSRLWSKLSSKRVPVNGVILSAVVAVLLTLPALVKVNIGTRRRADLRADRVLRRRVHRRRRSVRRVRHPDLLPLAGWQLVPAGLVEPRQQVALAGPSGRHRDHRDLGRRDAPDRQHRQPLRQGLRLEVRQLHADRGARRPGAAVGVLAPVGQEVVHRAEAHRRPGRLRHVPLTDRAGRPVARQDRLSGWSAAPGR